MKHLTTDQLFIRRCVWALFREVSPFTGMFLEDRLDENQVAALLDRGFIEECTPPEWTFSLDPDGWTVYKITESGVEAVRQMHHRDVWQKLGTKLEDSFKDGLIQEEK